MDRRRFLHTRDRGAVIPLVALLLPVLMIMTAFAVDLGRQRAARRDMQAVADVISLDMARLADGRTLDAINAGDAFRPSAMTALAEAATRNEVDITQLTLDWGAWDPVGGFASIGGLGTAVPNAARIVAVDSVEYYFQPGSGGVTREAVARFGVDPLAGFSVGSFGANLNPTQAGLLNGLLTPLLGNPVGLDVLSYQGLAGLGLNVFDIGTELGLLTAQEVLSTSVPLDDFMLASANVLRNQGNVAEASLLEGAITPQIEAMQISLGDLVNAESGAEDSAMAATVDVISAIRTAAFLARCTPGALDFTECSALSIPSLTTSLPLTTVTGGIKVIESPRYHYGRVGTGVNTGQVQVSLGTVVGAQNVGTCVPSLGNLFCVLGGLLVGAVDATVTLDSTLTLAGGRTTIQAIDCTDPAALDLDLRSNTDLYSLATTITVAFGRRGVLGGVLGPLLGSIQLTGSTSTNNTIEDLRFTVAPDILSETVRSTGAGSVGLAGLTLASNGTGVLGTLGGLGINRTLAQVLTTFVNPLLSLLDTQVLTPLTELLGLNVTGADLTAEAIDCDSASVQLVG